MSMSEANFVFNKQHNQYSCEGDWSILQIDSLFKKFKQQQLPSQQKIIIDGKALKKFDSSGAVTLMQCINLLEEKQNKVEIQNFTQQHHALLSLAEEKKETINYSPPRPKKESFIYQLGEEFCHKLIQAKGLIILIGDLSDKLFSAFFNFRRFQFPSIISNIYSTGITALPIIGLLSFLIGVVLAYQMGLQLETYGANIFIAYLSGMAIFREFAPLITAIIVAGRTSSAFTAQIGSMKINEEIDALCTMGLSPTELLVVPKVLGLLFFFPLLIFWSDFFSTLGAMIMSKSMLHVGYKDFLTRLHESVGFKQMMLGLYKAPTFAILIALVGCFQGFRVEANADSVGTQTTKSVVQALFLIIVADAIYSVIYSWLDL
ncbi:putative ABC transport system permease (plasmid) [Legionella adelaidensis]|uniref:ABC transporter permease n=1 Tax=Legionella adelaidensis TaxID=45056 RepID=A0A0W0R092_9GAMM|nr:ABC transporter permease [Legionella adelaidensis]KTC64477.1 ABC transporter permease [Legionella adelaidensis]VEH85845.1 putative ABC transport system permease [Legionella adelaidensis]